MDTSELRAGGRAVAPMLIGVIPFGLVAGATPAAEGYGILTAVGMSTLIFAGASQLAVIDVLAGGGTAVVAALTAWTINMRMLLYSASFAPHLANEGLPKRLATSYVLVDQVYATAIAHWANKSSRAKAEYAIGGGLVLGPSWITCTAIGAVAGSTLPEDLPLDFAVPLVFLVLLVPALVSRPAIAAAVVGGVVAVVTAEAGATNFAVIGGALAGIAAGVVADLALGTTEAEEASTE